MNIEQVNQAHDYIMEHNLLTIVEDRTKEKWKGCGSRATYYNGLSKTRDGQETTLVEELMLLEAHALMVEHSMQTSKVLQEA